MLGYPSPSSWRGVAIPAHPLRFAACLILALAPLCAQAPGPGGERLAPARAGARELVRRGQTALEQEDAVEAIRAFRAARQVDADDVDALLGLGRAQLLLGMGSAALATAELARSQWPDEQAAAALAVRAKIRSRDFESALALSTQAVAECEPGAELLSAHASALYRVQHNGEAAQIYRRVLELDPSCEEAHARLGSGLSAPSSFTPSPTLLRSIAALREERYDDALADLRAELALNPLEAVAHRLVGELLFQRRASLSIVLRSEAFRTVTKLAEPPAVDDALASEFVPAWPTLQPQRRAVVARTLAIFEPYLGPLLAKGARHDMLAEEERTTDAPARASLRGRRTFDGRVWDDVRGIGGLRAATGIEALDEAARAGFDTFAHEVAHQVHLHVLRDGELFARIKALHRSAVESDRVLDYYAATNWAEYFGQGVEAFVSLAKRPAPEATHGHTRFELMRIDPELHQVIASLVAFDPLGPKVDAGRRNELLRACIDAALLTGRVDDACTAAELLDDAAERARWQARARQVALVLDGA